MKKSNWTVYIPDGFGGHVEMDFFENMTRSEAATAAKAKWGPKCILEAVK